MTWSWKARRVKRGKQAFEAEVLGQNSSPGNDEGCSQREALCPEGSWGWGVAHTLETAQAPIPALSLSLASGVTSANGSNSLKSVAYLFEWKNDST